MNIATVYENRQAFHFHNFFGQESRKYRGIFNVKNPEKSQQILGIVRLVQPPRLKNGKMVKNMSHASSMMIKFRVLQVDIHI